MKQLQQKYQKIVVLSGAGISAESAISTFRDANGLWEGHDVLEVASPLGWQKSPELVLAFYNQRRQQLLNSVPNAAHFAIAKLQHDFDVSVVTQNVDDLHERAGSKSVLHLHGELLKSQSSGDISQVFPCRTDINIGDTCPKGFQLRPFIVWFGEAVPLLDAAIAEVMSADILIVVGSSMTVYPAAGLVSFAQAGASVFYIDANPSLNEALAEQANLTVIAEKAAIALPRLAAKLSNEFDKSVAE